MYWFTILAVGVLNVFTDGNAQNYKGGVVVYRPVTTTNNNDLTQDEVVGPNEENYIKLLEQYSNTVDILVFPEHGITGVSVEMIDKTQFFLVHAELETGPLTCKNETINLLTKLRCAVKQTGIYTIVNLIEKDGKENYATTVGFAPNGTICLKCRKHHLYNKPSFDKAPDQKSCSFTAVFGNRSVPFTVLFGDDLIYGIPSDLKNKNVIVTSAIKNILPLSVGFSLYQGFAITNGVNLLVSGYYEDNTDNYGGSGIYFSNGTSIMAYQPDDQKYSKVLISDIPIESQTSDKIQVKSSFDGIMPDLELKYTNISGLIQRNEMFPKCFGPNEECCINLETSTSSVHECIIMSNKTKIQDLEVFLCGVAVPSGNAINFKNSLIISKMDKSKVLQTLPIAVGPNLTPFDYIYDKENNSIILDHQEDVRVFGLIQSLNVPKKESRGKHEKLRPENEIRFNPEKKKQISSDTKHKDEYTKIEEVSGNTKQYKDEETPNSKQGFTSNKALIVILSFFCMVIKKFLF